MAINPLMGSNVAAATASTSATPQNAGMALPPSEQLNEEDFLTLLAAELKYQDPTNPVTNTQFIGELAQFSSLAASTQQETTLQKILSSVSGQTGSGSLLLASQLIGKTVTTSAGKGVVTGVITSQSGVEVELKGGSRVAVSDLQAVTDG